MVSLPQQAYPTARDRSEFFDRFGERLSAISALSGAAFASALPQGGGASRSFDVDSHTGITGKRVADIRTVAVSERYFATLGLQLLAGRAFTPADGAPGQLHAIVNERFASAHLGGTALGRRVRFTSSSETAASPWLTIIGVAPSVRQSPRPEPEPVVYVPFRMEPPPTAAVIVRASPDPSAVMPLLRSELQALDPNLPVYRVLSMQEAMAESSWNARVSATALTIIAMIALCLALVGLYAVTAHAVAQRTGEIGVRMALGARPVTIAWLVLRRASCQLAIGLAAGIVCTYAWGRLFGSGAWFDVVNLMGVLLAVSVVAIIACLVPARRAMRIDPVFALRME
jgi:putative ABC transport system permease protein